MKAPKYEYPLYGLFGEFMGITTSLKEAKAHKDRVKNVFYYRRYTFDPSNPDYTIAQQRGLPSNKGGYTDD